MRTTILRLSAAAVAVLSLAWAHQRAESIPLMSGAAHELLAALTDEQKAKAVFPFEAQGEDRLFWHFIPMPEAPNGDERVRKGLGVTLAVAGLSVLVGYTQALPEGAHLSWEEDYAAAAERARAEQKPLLVDFSASWCGACQELEQHTFSDPRVVREGERFVRVRIDLSPGKDSPEKREILAGYEHRGLPLVVMHKPNGEAASRVTTFVEADKMLELMKDARNL